MEPKILIVEDDRDLVETYTDLLEAEGYTVFSTLRASEAIRLAKSLGPDVIILDLGLPDNSGIDVAASIRSDAALANTVLFVITGHPEMADDSRVAGRADLVLSKPTSNEQLRTMIRRFLPSA